MEFPNTLGVFTIQYTWAAGGASFRGGEWTTILPSHSNSL